MGKETKKFLVEGAGGSYAAWEGCPDTGNPKCQSPMVWSENGSWCCSWHLEMNPFVSTTVPTGAACQDNPRGSALPEKVVGSCKLPCPRFPASTCPASQIMVA